MNHRSKLARVRLRTVCGLAGLVIAMTAWAVPGTAAAAAAPRPIGSNGPRLGPEHGVLESPAAAAGKARVFRPTCKGKHKQSVRVSAEFNNMHWYPRVLKRDKHGHPEVLSFIFRGKPRISVHLGISGSLKCKAKMQIRIPLDAPLALKIGPDLKFTATGKVDTTFTWTPFIRVGFKFNRAGHKFILDKGNKFVNGGRVTVTGSGTADLKLLLAATVQTLGGIAGVTVYAGPEMHVKVRAATTGETGCVTESMNPWLQAQAFLRFFGLKGRVWSPNLLKKIKPKVFFKTKCQPKAKTIVFDGTPGTGAPPATLGPYTMTPFAPDTTPEGTVETQMPTPIGGAVAFGPALTHALVGSNWATWSNGYTGDVYTDYNVLPNGDIRVTVTLPPGTGAFYAYAEPNLFQDYDMSATAAGGATSGNITVYGDAGAKYFGFYATCGHTLHSITYTDSGGDSGMAIGEFGIAPAC